MWMSEMNPSKTPALKPLVLQRTHKVNAMDSDKLNKPAHAKSYIVDTSPNTVAPSGFQIDGFGNYF